MNKENRVALKTMAMKARVSNYLRTELYPFSNEDWDIKYKGKKKITDAEKLKIFDTMFDMIKSMDKELIAYKHKRQYKALVEKDREERKSLA